MSFTTANLTALTIKASTLSFKMAMAQHPAALQARVHKLLSSRAEIESTKALLSTLVASEPAPGTQRRASHADASPTTTTATTAIVTMDANSSLADLRKNLRTSLEEKQLALAESVLEGLSQTLARVSLLRSNVESLDAKCSRIQRFLETTKRETQQVQADAALLADKKCVHYLAFPLTKGTDAVLMATERACSTSSTKSARSSVGTSSRSTRHRVCTQNTSATSTCRRS